MAATTYTVLDAMIAIGIDNSALFDGQTQAERIAEGLFDNDFQSCMDKSNDDIDDDLKTWSNLTVSNGQIRLQPVTKKRIKAFSQWVKDKLRRSQDPATEPFNVGLTQDLIRRSKTHSAFVEKAKTLADIAKPDSFSEKTKWIDWKPTFINYLKHIPGRSGVPLNYIVRPTGYTANPGDMLDEYVELAPHAGESYATDCSEVHTYIAKFIKGNSTAESIIISHGHTNNGREDMNALISHYEGTGINATIVSEAEKDIESLHYTGEKRPYMWWDRFELRLTKAFATIDKVEDRVVYSDSQKLRLLQKKVNADFLLNTKDYINGEMNKSPMVYTYAEALSSYKSKVNQKFPPQLTNSNRNRHISQIQGDRHGGRGRGFRGQGRGYQGHGGRDGGRGRGRFGSSNRSKRGHPDAKRIRGKDGRQIEIHPSYDFPGHIWANIPREEQDKIREERERHKSNKRVTSAVSTLISNSDLDAESVISALTEAARNRTISQVTARIDADGNNVNSNQNNGRTTMMGGRSEQGDLRTRNRSIRALTTKRCIGAAQAQSNDIEPKSGTIANNEADSNADTCCLGSNFIVLRYTNKMADVYPYNNSYEPIANVPIVSGATAYTDVASGQTYILVFNESLYYGTRLPHSLFNPNQIRHHGVDVWDNPYDKEHELSIEVTGELTIPLGMEGTKTTFQSRAPTKEELDTCPHIQMTSDYDWQPTTVRLGKVQTTQDDRIIMTMNEQSNPLAGEHAGQYVYKNDALNTEDRVLHDVEPSLLMMKERMIANINVEVDKTNDPLSDLPAMRTFISTKRHAKATAFNLAERWGIGIKSAENTLKVTTQRGVRSAIMPISRRYRADRYYGMKRLNSKFSTDTFYSRVKSLLGHTHAQVYSNKTGFSASYPMYNTTGESIGESLRSFSHDFGVPEHLTFDGAMSQVGKDTKFMKTIREYDIKHHVSAPRRPNENPAEGQIRELKRRWFRIMTKKDVPERIWDFGLVWVCETGNLSVSSSRHCGGRTPIESITGETPDISEYLDFGFYDWVIYRSNAGLGEPSLGRWIGVSHKVGQLMSYWILTSSGHVISCVTVQRLTNADQQTDEWRKKMEQYDAKIKERLDITNFIIPRDNSKPFNSLSLENDDTEFDEEFLRARGVNDDRGSTTQGKPTPDTFDPYLNMEVGLPRGSDDNLLHATVKRRALDDNGNPIGTANKNPILDSRMYEVEFMDGTKERLTANIIAENVMSQVDAEGNRQMLLREIIDHRCDLPTTNMNGDRKRKQQQSTIDGWTMCCEWKDGSTSWVPLKEIKESYAVETAEYAVMNGIQHHPAFSSWVPYVIKKRKQIISKVKSKYWARTHKYGIRIPKSVKEAFDIDKQNGNSYWRDAINEEMEKIKRDAVKVHDGDPKGLVGYQQISGHIIFDVKLGENFRRKARYVADGHKTEIPSSVTYSSVVSRESVRICLTIAALNGLDILTADIENAYLTAPCREKCWLRAGPEFGSDEGKVMIVKRALYGLKSSGAAFRSFLATRLDEIGFVPSEADPDVWLRRSAKPDGEQYYEYVLCYVDDIMSISHEPSRALKQIQEQFKFKKDKMEPPEVYLGGNIEKKRINDHDAWTLCSMKYIKAAIDTITKAAEERGIKMNQTTKVPMHATYYPELDTSEELQGDDITFYQEVIGILRWAIELGRVDIHLEVSLMSAYQASPRRGHLEELIHIVAYLKHQPKLTLYFDPERANIDESIFASGSSPDQFQDLYRDANEELPERMPQPLGISVRITSFVDASHAANKVNRRSHTGFVIFVNRAPIIWFSKRQNTVESSTFSSEFIAMKTCMESIVALRYKLRMFGVPIDGPADVLCDNQSVVLNSSCIDSALNKKHNALAYHATRWSVAAGVMRVGKIDTKDNIADAFTKRLTYMQRAHLFHQWTY